MNVQRKASQLFHYKKLVIKLQAGVLFFLVQQLFVPWPRRVTVQYWFLTVQLRFYTVQLWFHTV